MFFLLSDSGQEQINRQIKEIARANISLQDIHVLKFPRPSLLVQHKIATILISINQKIAAEQSRKEAFDTLFTSLLHDLMTAKIRVKNIA